LSGARDSTEPIARGATAAPTPEPEPEAADSDEAKTRVSVAGPAEFLSIFPVMVGFQPTSGDILLTGLDERGPIVVTARFGQLTPDVITAEQLGPMLSNIVDAGATEAMLTGYGPGQQVTAAVNKLATLVDPVMPIRDALRVEGDRYWSYYCQDTNCCPPEGRQFQAESGATTALRVAGLSTEATRGKLAERFAPPTGEQADAARQAWTEALAMPLSSAEGRVTFDQALQDCRQGKPIDSATAVRVATALRAIPVRDYAWAHMTSEYAEAHLALWTGILRQVPPEAAPAPASLLAWTAWQRGNGTLGNLAVDRALEADPDYSLARLLRETLSPGLPPTLAVPPMTPEQSCHGLPRPETSSARC
jgi:Domain of unknown function (DUF4192)